MKKAAMLTPCRQAARRFRHALMMSTGLLLAPGVALGQSASCSGSALACTIPSGNYNQPLALLSNSSASVTFANNGNFTVTTDQTATFLGVLQSLANGPSGAFSSTSDASPGGIGGTIAFTNNGVITHSISALLNAPNTAVTVYGGSIGGNGGAYDNTDAKYNAGAAAAASAATLSNLSSIRVTGGSSATPSTLMSGAALLVDSLGGNGGNVFSNGTDQNGNPTYHTALGTPGADGANATLTNSGQVSASFTAPLVSLGYWGVAARSLGGNGGTGNDGTAGGAAGSAAVTNTGDVNVSIAWGGPVTGAPDAPVMPGAFAVHARSQGGNGNMSVNSGNDGGAGGAAGAASVTAGLTGNAVGLTLATQNPGNLATTPLSAAIGAISLGGNGGAGYDSSTGGKGGDAGPVTVQTQGSLGIRATGDRTLGILALAQGGHGGTSGVGQDNSTAGDGGSTGYYTNSSPAVNVSLTSTTLTTAGTLSTGVMAASMGGAGGTGLPYSQALQPDAEGGTAGGGGNTGPVQVTITGGSTISTTGAQSPAVVALAQGGPGGAGGAVNALGGGSGSGGSGGQGANVTVSIGAGVAISTSGGPSATNTNPSYGVYAASIGGAGGAGGGLNTQVAGGLGNGGYGGGAYAVSVSLAAGASVSTSGQSASAVVARSLGGAGGSANDNTASGLVSVDGNGGNGGSSGTVTVTNAATLTTLGAAAHGIAALSSSGISGNGGEGDGVIYSSGGNAGVSGTTGSVSVTNTGVIATSGSSAFGIQAQSVGGGTGTGGKDSGFILGFGGSSTAASDGGAASVSHSGAISTRGDYAMGILAQSVGGSGGNAGDTNGGFVTVGGSGGGGGNGGSATVTLGSGGTIATLGRLAHGVVAQAIGGGGGNAGDATSVGTGVTLSIGGSAGAGGAGGSVSLNATGGNISTAGSNAMGLAAQSIGGGGGTGGSAISTGGGALFTVGVAVGGTGGAGGNGGSATANLAGINISTATATTSGTNLNPVDAYGIVLQSVGGGGGAGGSAAAQAVTAGIPVTLRGDTVAATITTSVGGAGGTAGNGGAVSLTLNGGSSVTTQGQGSHALILQSIGGGGGVGGDSSSLAATIAYGRATAELENAQDFSLDVAVGVGGSGQHGGLGGTVSANIDASNIVTLGDYANGLVAQSVGGGGGNAGVGSSTTLASGATRNLTLAVGVGGGGGAGGAGGNVSLIIGPQAVIQTYGASALGVVAQSIGGGGGTAQGTTVNLAGYVTVDPSTPNQPSKITQTPGASVTVSVGATGSSGGSAGTVTSSMQGQVRTNGSDSTGVLLQAVGGGGGIGGSAGSEASSDNTVSIVSKARLAITEVVGKDFPFNFTAVLSIGGSGGTAGNGGTINHSQTGSIVTQGDWSHGLVAQSIGGGGGMGGVATAGSSNFGFTGSVAVGGSGGAGGNGGAVNLTFGTGASISTGLATSGTVTGYGAFGVLAQSIGGGGGTGVDGSTASLLSINLGIGGSGTGGSGGDGNAVTVTKGAVSIATRGDVGVAMVLQSIGGGGGLAGSGTSFSAGVARFAGTINVQVGSTTGASGQGGQVTIDNATLTIQTSGANAFGVLAQSIGGGGGFGFTPSLADTVNNMVGARVGTSALATTGGTVQLNLVGGSIRTSGMGAHGIVAQSIGGGGGIAGLPTGPATMTTLAYRDYAAGSTPSGVGGQVNINSSTPITTTGAFAHGIIAQSIGGGGGIFAQGTQVYAGLTNSGNGVVPPTGFGGPVSINQSAPITVSGANSVGIFAQSVAVDVPGVVQVTVSALIKGGSGAQGWGIWADSANTASLVTVAAGGSVSALSGQAIQMTAGNVSNQGTVTGSYALNLGGTFANAGRLNAGPSLVAGQLLNTGDILVGALTPYGVSRVSGDFVQRSSGRLLLDADFSNRRSDVMTVAGAANLAGRVRPLIATVLPYVELPFLVVSGAVTGSIQGEQTAIFGYDINRKGGTFSVSANADFTPAGYNLARNAGAAAGHLQSAWDAGGAGLGALFALLGNTADAGGEPAYSAALKQISPNAALAPGARVAAGARGFANAAMSCPQFEGTTAMLTEGECVWAGLTGRTAGQSGSDGLSSFRLNAATWQAGGQRSLGGGWFLGGSIAYENTRLTTTDRLNGGRGQAGYAAITTKYQTGPWLFAGAVFGGGGAFNGTRNITLPGFGSIARGSPTLSNVGAMLRGTYTIGREEFYLRPSLSLSLVHARSSSYSETGAGVLNLSVSDASSTVAALTPALEVGGRVNLQDGMVLRLYTSAGVSWLSEGQWSQQSRLSAAPAAAAAFSTVVRTDQVVGRVTAGAQLFATNRLELRLQYEGEYSAKLTGHGGSFAVAYRF